MLVQRAKSEMDLDVLSCWGMTKNAGLTITRRSDPQEKVFTTDGRALPGCEVRVVDDRKRPVLADAVGHLQARGITHFVGYHKKPQLNSIDEDGWFDTGDLARMDRDGYIRIVGRTKDIIIRGGENISAAEVESVLCTFPGVLEVAVVAAPDPKYGERGCAFLRVVPGRSQPTIDELRAHLRAAGLAAQKWPEELRVVADFERTPSGKVKKHVLRDQLRAR